MRDPNPDNIKGLKEQRHTFKHEINWGHVAIAVAVIFAVWVGANRLSGDGSNRDDDTNTI